MNIDKKAGHIDPKVALSQAEHDKRDVRQVVKILNPDKNSMESRG